MKLLLISDLHGNKEALDAVLANVKYDQVVCLGDLVDYGPDPMAVIDWVRDNKIPTVRGNHDNAVALHVDCGCGYKYKHLSEATREYTWSQITEKEEEFLMSLPVYPTSPSMALRSGQYTAARNRSSTTFTRIRRRIRSGPGWPT
jgi:predicted phosphodiesterase